MRRRLGLWDYVTWQVPDDTGTPPPADPTPAPADPAPPITEASAALDSAPDTAPAADPTTTAPAPPAEPSGVQRRFDQLTAEKWTERRAREAAEAQARLLMQQNEELLARLAPAEAEAPQAPAGERTFTRAEVEQYAQRYAQTQAQAVSADVQFNTAVNAEVTRGQGKFQDFNAAVSSLQALTGPNLPRELVEAALETGKAAEVLYTLGKDHAEADKILSLPPLRQAVAIARLAEKLAAEPASAQVSRAPAPITPRVGGSSSVEPDLADEKIPIGEWMKQRAKQLGLNGSGR